MFCVSIYTLHLIREKSNTLEIASAVQNYRAL